METKKLSFFQSLYMTYLPVSAEIIGATGVAASFFFDDGLELRQHSLILMALGIGMHAHWHGVAMKGEYQSKVSELENRIANLEQKAGVGPYR